MSVNNRVLVAGAQGVSGRAALEHWKAVPATQVVGLSRRAAPCEAGVEHISVDLLDVVDTRQRLSSIRDVTHIVFGAYVERATPSEKTEDNVAILKNLLGHCRGDVAKSPARDLLSGRQGLRRRPWAIQDACTRRRPAINATELLLRSGRLSSRSSEGKQWHWTALRPEAVCGFAVGNPMNLAMVIAVYATLSKELGLPLRFPGTEKAYGPCTN
jgi:hypothetical protein